MEYKNIISRLFLIVSIYLVVIYKVPNATAASPNTNFELHRPRTRTVSRFVPRPMNPSYVKLKPETINNDFLIDDDDLFELSKRQQTSDDYGHLRFGKRDEPFEDYGHMRFGRGGNDK